MDGGGDRQPREKGVVRDFKADMAETGQDHGADCPLCS